MEVKNIMLYLTRGLIDLICESSSTKVMVGDNFSVGNLVMSILKKFFYRIRVVALGSKVLRGHQELGMLGKAFLRPMQYPITSRSNTRHLLTRLMVIFVNNCFYYDYPWI